MGVGFEDFINDHKSLKTNQMRVSKPEESQIFKKTHLFLQQQNKNNVK